VSADGTLGLPLMPNNWFVRGDLLQQMAFHDRIDLSPLLKRISLHSISKHLPGVGRRLARPRNFLTREITNMVAEYVSRGENELTYDDEHVMAHDRALGVHLAGNSTQRL
jgi:hypothetical protein